MTFINFIKLAIPALLVLSLCNCSKDSNKLTNPIIAGQPEYSLVFDHGNGELCYYPRISSNGRYLAFEREEIVSPPGYVAHIWVYDMSSGEARKLTDNPTEGYYDDRNLRFAEADSVIYFIRTHWHLNYTNERTLCRIPLHGSEEDVEQLPDGGMNIYCFDLIPRDCRLLIAYYNPNILEYHTGFLDLQTGNIALLQHMDGLRHNCFVSLPDGSGFIASTGLAGSNLFSYKLTRHNFDAQPSVQFTSPKLIYLVWVLSINPTGDRLLVHQGVCTKSLTHSIPLSGGSTIQLLTEYSLPRDALWGLDKYIYFTIAGNIMRYGPL